MEITESQSVPTLAITTATEPGTPMPNGRSRSLPPIDSTDPSSTSDISMSNSQPLPFGTNGSQSIGDSLFPPSTTGTTSALTDDNSQSQSNLSIPSHIPPISVSSTQTTTNLPTASSITTGPKLPDWTPNQVDTDTLARRLAKFKYHCPADFLSDIDKIKLNADKVGDSEKSIKIAEMVSHAYLHVAEFDPRWGPEFEAYAERMRVRKVKKKLELKKKEEEEEEEIGKGKGKEKDIGEDEGGYKGSKRLRGDGDDDREEGGGQPVEKRMRMDVGENDGAEGSRINIDQSNPSSTDQIITVPPPAPPPAPVYPPFNIPESALSDLTISLKNDTDGFSVEELEQLRAGIFGRIWKKRGEWDRSELINDLSPFLGKMSKSVKSRKEIDQ